MPLIDLKTDLKSLKYGHDRPGGGNSGQPYETVDINAIDQGLQSPLFRNGDDGLIRGGFDGAFKSSVIDARRISKLFKDAPKGPLWITKQILLQQTNPQLEVKKTPDVFDILTGDLSSIPVVGGALQPTRFYNLGKNTLAQVPVNAFGVHFNRHGLLPVQDDNTKYLAVAQANNLSEKNNSRDWKQVANRLLSLKKKFELGDGRAEVVSTGSGFLDRLLGFAKQILPIKFEPKNLTIYNYTGGPNSAYGIGNTLIKRYDNTEIVSNALTKSRFKAGRAYNANDRNNNSPVALDKKRDLTPGGPSSLVYGVVDLARFSNNPSTRTYQQIKRQNDTQATKGVFGFNPVKNTALGAGGLGDLYNGAIINYTNNPIEYRNGIDAKLKLNGSWKTLNRETRVGSGRKDQINLTPLFYTEAGTIGDKVFINNVGYVNINDLVKFRIQSIDTDSPDQAVWMIFRAYITQFTDNVDATWNDVKYVGRGENFYIYSGFTRKINIGFKVAALSAQEMKPMYQKLNYLMGNLMPDYSKDDNLLMRGPLVRMTVGNWIDGQAGILNSLNYTVPQDSPWEIAVAEPIIGERKLILPHIVEVNMTFTPIGSQTFKNNKISEKSLVTSHIAQNINDYQYIGEGINAVDEGGFEVTRRQPIQAAPIQFTDRSTRAGSPLNQPVNIPNLPTPSIVRGGG